MLLGVNNPEQPYVQEKKQDKQGQWMLNSPTSLSLADDIALNK